MKNCCEGEVICNVFISGPYFSMHSCVVAVVGRIVLYYIRFTRMNNDVILKWVGGWSHHFVFV